MPAPAAITDLSTTAASNSPAGSETPSVLDDVQRAHAAFIAQLRDNKVSWGGTAGGTANAFTLTPSPASTSYVTGQSYQFLAVGTNTGAVTTNVSSLGAKAVQFEGAALSGGEIVSGKMYSIRYDGTQFQLERSSLQAPKAGADIASAATLNLSTATGNTVRITGTTATSAVTMNTGQWCVCIADAAWPLTYHATTNKLNTGGANYTCAAGDRVLFVKDGSGVIQANIIPVTSAFLAAVQTWTAGQRGAVSVLTDGATVTPDFALSNNFSLTLGGNRTLANPTNAVAGQSGVIAVTQDGTGTRTLSYGANYKFAGGTAITLTTTAGAVDYLSYYAETASRIFLSAVKDVK